jgi:hypothetical protein
MVTYSLRTFVIGSSGKVELTEHGFDDLRSAHRALGLLSELTENYSSVVESYRALEMTKFEVELNRLLYSRPAYEESLDTGVTLNAPISGYLATGRSFHDAADRLLSELMSSEAYDGFKKFRSAIYDTTPGYRFIEALRNHTQHRGSPLHMLTNHEFMEDPKDFKNTPIVTAISLSTLKEILLNDPKFKKDVLDGMPDRVDLIQSIRVHMEGLWKIYDYFSNALSDTAEHNRVIIANAIKRFVEQTKESPIGLYACVEMADGEIAEKVPVFLDWEKARQAAHQKLRTLVNLPRRYITGKTGLFPKN